MTVPSWRLSALQRSDSYTLTVVWSGTVIKFTYTVSLLHVAVTSRLRSSQTFPKVRTRTQHYCSFIQYGLNHYQRKTNKSGLFYICLSLSWLVVLCVSFMTVMFRVCCLMSLTRLCFVVFLSLYFTY